MNILFFYSPHSRLNLIAQIQLEIILEHLQCGDTVHFVHCNGKSGMGHCTSNFTGQPYYCYACKKMQDKIYRIAQAHGQLIIHNYLKVRQNRDIPAFPTVDILKKYQYKGINIGMGVASTIISILRDHKFDLTKKRNLIIREILLTQQVVNTIESLSKQIEFDMVYVFNGRMSHYAAIVQWCRIHHQTFRVYEFTTQRDKYHIVNNTIPHDVDYESADIERHWQDSCGYIENKIAIGKQFFENSRKGIPMLEESFIAAQKQGKLPNINPNIEIITFFNSSIDEYASVPGWDPYIYLFEDEVDAIKQVCIHYQHDKTKQFILRIHPNLKYLNNTQTRRLRQLQSLNNLLIVSPTSSISSYSLIDISNKIITFGSTVGVEATYFKTASILLGLCFYRDLNAAYTPQNRTELFALLDNPQLAPKPQLNAIKFGYWRMSFGNSFIQRFTSYQPTDLNFTEREKTGVLMRKIFSTEIIKRAYKLLKPATYSKFTDKRFRQALTKEFIPWNKK